MNPMSYMNQEVPKNYKFDVFADIVKVLFIYLFCNKYRYSAYYNAGYSSNPQTMSWVRDCYYHNFTKDS